MSELLGKLAGALDQGQEQRDASGPRSWIAWVVGAVLALVGVTVGAFVLWRNRSELARLRHAEAVREIEVRSAETDVAIAENNDQVADARREAAAAKTRALEAAATLAEAEDRYARDLAAVDRIRSWADVDPSARR